MPNTLRRNVCFGLALVLFAAPFAALAAPRYPVTVALKEGDTVTGVGVVTTIDNLAVASNGTWIVQSDTDAADTNADVVLVRNGVAYLRENDALPAPPGAAISSFDGMSVGETGLYGGNLFLRNLPANADSGVFVGADVIIPEGFVSTSPEFSPNTPYIGFFEAKIVDASHVAIVASVDDSAIASTVDRALVIAAFSGGSLVSEDVIAKENDLLPGQATQRVVDFGTGPHLSMGNSRGEMLYFADLDGATTTDGVVYRNGTLIAQEGSPSPIPGRNHETLSSRGLALNNFGGWAIKSNLDGDTADDEVLIANDREVVREGATFDDISPWNFTGFGTTSGPVYIDDYDNVLWYGDWNDPDATRDTGLFLNNILLVRKGDTVGGGAEITTFANGEDAFALSDDGQYALFEVTLDTTISAALLMEVQGPPPVPDGYRVPGTPMRLSKNGNDLEVTWDTGPCPATNYSIFYGSLAGMPAYEYDGAVCLVGASGQATFSAPDDDLYFILASANAERIEGAHGFDSEGRTRPAAANGLCGVVGQIRSGRCP